MEPRAFGRVYINKSSLLIQTSQQKARDRWYFSVGSCSSWLQLSKCGTLQDAKPIPALTSRIDFLKVYCYSFVQHSSARQRFHERELEAGSVVCGRLFAAQVLYGLTTYLPAACFAWA